MAISIFEVDPRDFAPSSVKTELAQAGEGIGSEVQVTVQDREHPERMEVLRKGIEEHLASATGETGLFERLHEYFAKEASKKPGPLQARASQ